MKQLNKLLNSLVLGAALLATPIFAETAEDKGLMIATELKARDIGWHDSIAKSTMILRNSRGQEAKRNMRIKSLEVEGDGNKGLTIFDRPRDVKGTAFLTFSHTQGADEQWMYLPALKRVKRIATSNKSGPFMGSEFAFEDISSFEVDKYTYKYLRDEKINGKECFVLESVPVSTYSGYTRQLMWIDKTNYLMQQIEFYDRKNALLKTLVFHDYKLYLNKYWRAMKMSMVNQQNGKSTDLITNELVLKTGLTEKDFSQSTLKRAK